METDKDGAGHRLWLWLTAVVYGRLQSLVWLTVAKLVSAGQLRRWRPSLESEQLICRVEPQVKPRTSGRLAGDESSPWPGACRVARGPTCQACPGTAG